eukprot:1263127-Amphidinium_carterae.1
MRLAVCPALKKSERHLCYQYTRHYPHLSGSNYLGYQYSRHHPHLPASDPCPPHCVKRVAEHPKPIKNNLYPE